MVGLLAEAEVVHTSIGTQGVRAANVGRPAAVVRSISGR
jgi:hypothetical protein